MNKATLGNSQTVIGAKHKLTSKKVAIKVISKEGVDLASDRPFDTPELALSRLLPSMRPKGVAKFIEIFEDHNYAYLVTSMMHFGDLQSFMEGSSSGCKYLCEEELRGPAKLVASTLWSIHKLGFLHNDVQPGNILLNSTKTGQTMAALGGFGYVSHLGDQNDGNAVQPNSINEFSSLYRSPEVILERGVGQASDVWSLGVTLFALATGKLPFASEHAIVEDALDWTVVDQSRSRILLSDQFKSLVTVMLEKDESARPTAEQVLTHAWLNKATKI